MSSRKGKKGKGSLGNGKKHADHSPAPTAPVSLDLSSEVVQILLGRNGGRGHPGHVIKGIEARTKTRIVISPASPGNTRVARISDGTAEGQAQAIAEIQALHVSMSPKQSTPEKVGSPNAVHTEDGVVTDSDVSHSDIDNTLSLSTSSSLDQISPEGDMVICGPVSEEKPSETDLYPPKVSADGLALEETVAATVAELTSSSPMETFPKNSPAQCSLVGSCLDDNKSEEIEVGEEERIGSTIDIDDIVENQVHAVVADIVVATTSSRTEECVHFSHSTVDEISNRSEFDGRDSEVEMVLVENLVDNGDDEESEELQIDGVSETEVIVKGDDRKEEEIVVLGLDAINVDIPELRHSSISSATISLSSAIHADITEDIDGIKDETTKGTAASDSSHVDEEVKKSEEVREKELFDESEKIGSFTNSPYFYPVVGAVGALVILLLINRRR